MIINPDGKLHIYVLSVGQGDCTLVVSPNGSVCIIDAYKPEKLSKLLHDLGNDGNIELMILSHPHTDHFSGASRIAVENKIDKTILAPYWHSGGMGPASYRKLVSRLANGGTRLSFLSGYSRISPDNLFKPNSFDPDPNSVFFEFLGPTNSMIKNAEAAGNYNTNHLTVMSRIAWRKFRMIVAGDAQMENWQAFDSERLMEDSCQVLRTAHHGSSNGTQWERISRLGAQFVIVSSDPSGKDRLPDLASSAVFTKYNHSSSRSVFITKDTGTIHISSTGSSRPVLKSFNEDIDDPIDINSFGNLRHSTNSTDWFELLDSRIANL